MLKINRALVSLSDKSGLETLAGTLKKHQIAVLSTGKTAEALAGFGISVSSVAEVTGFPETLGGRVKTLHPAIHAGILARKGHREDLRDLEQEGIEHIDLVVVNLYPFAAVRRRGGSAEEIIENIDIGGITLIRAAAKNHHNVVLITSPDDYEALGRELDAHSGKVSDAFRRARVRDAFLLTADYDRQIASYFAADYHREAPESSVFLFGGYAAKKLRYGENPHQTGTFYADAMPPVGLAAAKLLQGKEPSYNNYADADMAMRIVRSFTKPACAIIKHAQSCGVAESGGPADAYRAAYRADPESAFGGVIAFNSALDRETALAVSEQFAELVIAPEILPEAAEIFKKKRNLRVFVVGEAGEYWRCFRPANPTDAGNQKGQRRLVASVAGQSTTQRSGPALGDTEAPGHLCCGRLDICLADRSVLSLQRHCDCQKPSHMRDRCRADQSCLCGQIRHHARQG